MKPGLSINSAILLGDVVCIKDIVNAYASGLSVELRTVLSDAKRGACNGAIWVRKLESSGVSPWTACS